MSNIFNNDFREFIILLNKHNIEYVLIGGYTVILYGYPRTTGDLDVWLNRTELNRVKLIKACVDFGLPTSDLTTEKFLNDPGIEVFTYGRPPLCIDLLVKVKDAEFSDTFSNSVIMNPDGFPVRVVSYPDLVKLKKSAGRPKDLDDLKNIPEQK